MSAFLNELTSRFQRPQLAVASGSQKSTSIRPAHSCAIKSRIALAWSPGLRGLSTRVSR
jgi:hypothetical protein